MQSGANSNRNVLPGRGTCAGLHSIATMSGLQCSPPGSLPELTTLPIPQNITFAVVPANGSEDAMDNCCNSNTMHQIQDCYIWCELPGAQLNMSKVAKNQQAEQFSSCLRQHGGPERRLVGFYLDSSASSKGASLLGLGMCTAMMVAMMHF